MPAMMTATETTLKNYAEIEIWFWLSQYGKSGVFTSGINHLVGKYLTRTRQQCFRNELNFFSRIVLQI